MSQLSTGGKAIAGFSRTRTGFWVGVSFALHAALILGTSKAYIHDRWIDPKGAEARRAAEEEAKAQAAAATVAPVPATKPTAPVESKAAPLSDEEQMKRHADNPIVKKSTEAAKPAEIPKKPDDLGISLEETNVKGK